MELQYDVIVVGNYTIDLIFTGLPHFPVLGEDTVGTGFGMIPGEAYTSAVAMHRLGLKVGWAADFGNDVLSRLALEFVRAEGLDEALFIHHDRPLRRLSAAASFPEERGFMTYYDPDPQPPAAFYAILSASARALYVPGLYAGPDFEAFAQLIKSKAIKLIMDGNCDRRDNLENPGVRKAITLADVFLPNVREICQLTGESDPETALRILASLGPLVAIKAGADGSYALEEGQLLHAPAIPVSPIDTTGAGDLFSSAFTKAWLDGRPLLECLRWGNIAGGLSTLKHGGTGERITCKEIETWLE
jgi:sugar/nucleoside kinase (ribokinase family)